MFGSFELKVETHINLLSSMFSTLQPSSSSKTDQCIHSDEFVYNEENFPDISSSKRKLKRSSENNPTQSKYSKVKRDNQVPSTSTGIGAHTNNIKSAMVSETFAF